MFARPPSVRPGPVEIDRLVARTADLLSSDPAFKDVRVEVQGAVPPIAADAELLQIVFQNLLVNGAHAMQGHGTIQISVKAVDSSCQIAFSDAGPGIPPEILRQDLHAVLYDQVAWIGAGPSNGEASRRGAPRADWHQLSTGRRHYRHHQSARHRASGMTVPPRTVDQLLKRV